jgi:hypothetical protein
MRIVPFEPWHVLRMEVQNHQMAVMKKITPEYLRVLALAGPAYSAIDHGEVLACAGIVEVQGVHTLWGLLSRHAGRRIVRLDRCVRRMLNLKRYARVESTTEAGFTSGCRWLESLGFKAEATLNDYVQPGEAHILYVRES